MLSKPNVVYKFDILFVLDKSKSMSPIFEILRQNIKNFISSINNSLYGRADVRLGLLAYSNREFIVLDFTKDLSKFISVLNSVKIGGDELTLVALDYGMSKFSWTPLTRRPFIVVLTDEEIKNNYDYAKQKRLLDHLIQKLQNSPFLVYVKAPEKCRIINGISKKVPHVLFYPFRDKRDFMEDRFKIFLEFIAGSMSAYLIKDNFLQSNNIGNPVYNLQSYGIKVITYDT